MVALDGKLDAGLVEAIVESERQNPHSVGPEKAFAEKVSRYPQVLALRWRRMGRILDLLAARDGVVLDIGAGKGLNAMLAALGGAREVYAVEMGDGRFRSAQLMLDYLDKHVASGLAARVHLIHADILELDLQGVRFDAVYSTEVLEHIADSTRLHSKVCAQMRPGGRVYHRTGANGANPIKMKTFSAHWERVERDILAPLRAQIILSAVGTLPSAELDSLVQTTRGLTEQEIIQVVGRWREDKDSLVTENAVRRMPRHPLTGAYYERPVHPKQTLAELEAAGFVARLIRPDFSNIFVPGEIRSLAYRTAGSLISATHPLSLWVAPWIEIVGVKSSDSTTGG